MTKLVETTSDVLPTLNKKNVAFPPQPPPCNVVPLLLPVGNNKISVCGKHDKGITWVIVVILNWHYCVLVLYDIYQTKYQTKFLSCLSHKVCHPSLLYYPVAYSKVLYCLILYRMYIQISRDTVLFTCYSFAHWERLFRNNKHVSYSFNYRQEKVPSVMLNNMDHYMFLGNWPPTPPPSQHFALSEK